MAVDRAGVGRKARLMVGGGLIVLLLALSYAGASGKTTTPSQTRRLAAALKACKKDKIKNRRQACERKARRRYPTRSRPSTKAVGEPGPATAPKPTAKLETVVQELTRARNERSPHIPTLGAVELGKKLFGTDCASCHGAGGEGTATGPNLLTAAQAQTNLGVMEELVSPAGAGMPTFHESLAFLEKEGVADFVTVELTRTEELVP